MHAGHGAFCQHSGAPSTVRLTQQPTRTSVTLSVYSPASATPKLPLSNSIARSAASSAARVMAAVPCVCHGGTMHMWQGERNEGHIATSYTHMRSFWGMHVGSHQWLICANLLVTYCMSKAPSDTPNC